MKLYFALIGCLIVGIVATPTGRIVGGDDAVLGQLPYQAALSVGGSYNCGAVILAQRFALTALTCVCSSGSANPWPPQLFTVIAGTIDLYNGGQRIRVEEITVNPNYNELSTGIALLRLSERFTLNSAVDYVDLANWEPPIGATVEISGWGRLTESNENMHRTLQVNHATVVEERECFTDDSHVSNDQVLCLGHPRKNGICRGDIGGPAVYEGTLVGLAGGILGECGSLLPDRFISIANNYDWIIEHMYSS